MKLLSFLIVGLLLTSISFSQERKVFKINPGQKLVEGIPTADQFKYPSFVPGEVFFRNGRVGSASMNYNILFGEIQFVDPKGDTLSLSDEQSISFINLGTDSFFYDHGYVESIESFGPIRLARKVLIGYVKKEKLDGYGQKTSASVDTYTTISTNQSLRDVVAKEILTFATYTTYYFGDKFNHFKVANKKNLISMYGKDDAIENKIESYLKEEAIDFRSENDLRKLAAFIREL